MTLQEAVDIYFKCQLKTDAWKDCPVCKIQEKICGHLYAAERLAKEIK